jgi:carbamoyltransferase
LFDLFEACFKDFLHFEWFDLKNLKESPTMSFAVDAYKKTIKTVPSVIHVDNTSRIQTVTKKQNYHFYNLIKEFYNQTKVPMLLNTSFNLSGKPLVETFDDAINALCNSEIEYLYLPEIETLVTIKN